MSSNSSRNLYEVYLEEGFAGVDGVGGMTATQYAWVLAAKNDKAERRQEEQEKAQRRAQN